MKGQLFCQLPLLGNNCKIFLIESKPTDFAESVVSKDQIEIYLGCKGTFEDLFESLLHELEEGFNWVGNTRFIPIDCDEKLQWENCIFQYDHQFFQQRCKEVSKIIVEIYQPLFKAHLQLN